MGLVKELVAKAPVATITCAHAQCVLVNGALLHKGVSDLMMLFCKVELES